MYPRLAVGHRLMRRILWNDRFEDKTPSPLYWA